MENFISVVVELAMEEATNMVRTKLPPPLLVVEGATYILHLRSPPFQIWKEQLISYAYCDGEKGDSSEKGDVLPWDRKEGGAEKHYSLPWARTMVVSFLFIPP